jgi:hypothetical protein
MVRHILLARGEFWFPQCGNSVARKITMVKNGIIYYRRTQESKTRKCKRHTFIDWIRENGAKL